MKTLAADALKQIRIAPRRPNSARKVPPIFPSIDRPPAQRTDPVLCRSPQKLFAEVPKICVARKVIDSGRLHGDIHHAEKSTMKVLKVTIFGSSVSCQICARALMVPLLPLNGGSAAAGFAGRLALSLHPIPFSFLPSSASLPPMIPGGRHPESELPPNLDRFLAANFKMGPKIKTVVAM